MRALPAGPTDKQLKRLRLPRSSAQLLVLLTVILAFRLTLVLLVQGHIGVDGGAYWMSFNHEVLGAQNFGIDNATRPPLSPGWLLAPFYLLLGYDVGYKVFEALAGLPLIAAGYLLARAVVRSGADQAHLNTIRLARRPRTYAPLAVAALLSVDVLHAEMLVTGMVPLLSMTGIALASTALLRLGDGPSRRWQIVLALSLPWMAYTNLTTAGIAAVTLPVLTIAVIAASVSAHPHWTFALPAIVGYVRQITLPVLAGLALSATALPWFLGSAPGDGKLRYEGPLVYLNHDPGPWFLWIVAVPLGVLAWKRGVYGMRAMGITLIALASLQLWLSWDEAVINVFMRSRFAMPLFLYTIIVGAWVRWVLPWLRERLRPAALPIIGTALASVLVLLFTVAFFNQERYSSFADPDVTAAMEYAIEHQDGGVVVTNSYAHAHWLTALSGNTIDTRWTFTVPGPPPKWEFADAQVRCVLGWTDCDRELIIENLDVRHVVIDARYPMEFNQRLFGEPTDDTERLWAPSEVQARAPWLRLAHQQGHGYVYEVQR